MDLALQLILRWWQGFFSQFIYLARFSILGDPGADSGGEGKSKREGKYGTKKKKRTARRVPGDNDLPDQFQTVAAVLPSDWAEKPKGFLAPIRSQNDRDSLEWSGKTLYPGLFSPFFSFLRAIFSRPFRLSLAPTGKNL